MKLDIERANHTPENIDPELPTPKHILVKSPDFKEEGRSETSGQKKNSTRFIRKVFRIGLATATFYAGGKESANPWVHRIREADNDVVWRWADVPRD